MSNDGGINAAIQIELSHGDTRLFRTNAGRIAWQGETVERTPNRLVLVNYRAIKLAPKGFLDLNGWHREDGRAIYTAIEGKVKPRKATPDQLRMIELIRAHGGRAGVAYTVDDARRIITGELI